MEVKIKEVVDKGTRVGVEKKIRTRRGIVKRKKYIDRWKEECQVDKVFNNIIGQKVKIRIKDLLVCSKPI